MAGPRLTVALLASRRLGTHYLRQAIASLNPAVPQTLGHSFTSRAAAALRIPVPGQGEADCEDRRERTHRDEGDADLRLFVLHLDVVRELFEDFVQLVGI